VGTFLFARISFLLNLVVRTVQKTYRSHADQ